ncbi:hypothetical protein [Sphingorhabdus sp. Alg239-R122]|uniref:hypothetical protein n=1 Tax=Sphingorhabdus sp. Alg239-R122 TaxID=2305989 RepID=UPI0013DA532A|nr:hypothetical protein [Sphingorhabdus sp. Alg239-R122]
MTDPAEKPVRRTPLAGGFFIALASIAGVFIGGFQGEPVIGLLAGFALGLAIAALVWLLDRR